MPDVLTEAQLRAVETAHGEGLTSQQIVGVFESHDIRFSEANLRRYVQLGLVPRSRRTGQKGKHLGSHGVYPVRTIRRINTIKRLMAERYTLEEIQARFMTFKDSVETLEEALETLLSRFEGRILSEPASEGRERLLDELRHVRERADDLFEGVQRLEKLLVGAAGDRRPRGPGAASPTELL